MSKLSEAVVESSNATTSEAVTPACEKKVTIKNGNPAVPSVITNTTPSKCIVLSPPKLLFLKPYGNPFAKNQPGKKSEEAEVVNNNREQLEQFQNRRKPTISRHQYSSLHPKQQSKSTRRCLKAATFKYHTKHTPYPTMGFVDKFENMSISLPNLVDETSAGDHFKTRTISSRKSDTPKPSRFIFSEKITSTDSGRSSEETNNFEAIAKASEGLPECKVSDSSLTGPLFRLSSRPGCTDLSIKSNQTEQDQSTAARCSQGIDCEDSLLKAASTSSQTHDLDTGEEASRDLDILDLSSYMEDYFHLPKQMSSMAEMMYA